MTSWIWIPITLFAVVMQTVRTAGQKHLTVHLDPIAVTLVRFLFGLPFAALYLACIAFGTDATIPAPTLTFVGYIVLGGVGQIIATVLLIYLFSLRNFAVGTTYARTEAFLTAFIGAALVTRQGRATLHKAREDLAAGVAPARHLADGVMILVAGALLLTPGFLTDAIGFLLLVPAIRGVVRRWGMRRFRPDITIIP